MKCQKGSDITSGRFLVDGGWACELIFFYFSFSKNGVLCTKIKVISPVVQKK